MFEKKGPYSPLLKVPFRNLSGKLSEEQGAYNCTLELVGVLVGVLVGAL